MCFIIKALKTFQNGKSPGNDGLTAEFYQLFRPTLGHLLVDSYKSCFEKGELANKVLLNEKKNKNKRYVANWRFISLLYEEIKLVLSNNIKTRKVLSDLISASAYVKGRNIFDVVRTR